MSDVKATLLRLRQLQGWDDEIRSLTATRERLPRDLRSAERALDEASAEHAAHRDKIKHLKADIDALEMQIKTAEARVQDFQRKQNTAASNQIYAALTVDITNTRAEMAKLEEQELGLMEKLDAAMGELPKFVSRQAERQAELDRQKSQIDQKIAAIDQQIAEIEAQKKDIAAGIDAVFLSEYTRIRDWRNGTAVTGVTREGFCQACQTKVTPETMSRVMGQREVVTCPSCKRILYLADPLAQ